MRLGTKAGRLLAVVALAVLSSAAAAGAQAKPGLWAEIKQRGKVVVATEAQYYPFEFLENGKIVGYHKDVLDRIIQAWGVQMEQLDLPFTGILPGLLQKKYDFVATALIINPERASRYAFTMPLAEVKVGVLKRKGDPKVKSVDSLSGLVVGTVPPTGGPAQFLLKYNESLKASGKGAAEIKNFQSSPDIAVALANQQVDVMVDSVPPLLGAMRTSPNTFELVGTIGEPFFEGWVTRPEDTDLRDALNAEIRKLRDSGELKRLQQKWFGYTMEIPTTGYLPPGAK
ncbi:MAG TPA: transporter substrate-binding domain-containing protein [Methylomirabilota bacterium]|nr:transporter substrate-binding domain-containing protein [Methylomirabilota bacterium]